MKIVILAAGKGERLMPLTRNTPKPLLDMGDGSTLLEHQIASLNRSGCVREIVLVIGYLAAQVEAKLKAYERSGLAIRTVFNPFYEVSNNLMSLWLARHEMDADFLVTNGDNLFADDVFRDFADATDQGIHLAVNRKAEYDYDDMKVTLDGEQIASVSKDTPPGAIEAESPGLALVRGGRARSLFVAHLERLAREPEMLGAFWLEVFNSLYAGGVPVLPWYFDSTGRWQELDVHVDVRRMRDLVLRSMREARVETAVSEVLERDAD